MCAGDDTAYVTASDGKMYTAKGLLFDSKHEISIYKLEGVKNPATLCKSLEVSTDESKPGDPLVSIGAAGSHSLFGAEISAQKPEYIAGKATGVAKRGDLYDLATRISLLFPKTGDRKDPMTEASELCILGYSGGPWLNQSGKVAAITVGTIRHFFSANKSVGEQAHFLKSDLDLLKAASAKTGGLTSPLRLD